VVDDLGRELVLTRPAQRVVSLAPNITEILFALGAGERIVGADQYSNYPDAARSIPRISNHAAANYEQILALAPDVVIGWQSGNGRIPARIRELALPVFEIEPRRLDDLPGLFLRLGVLTGLEAAARARGAEFENRLQALRDTQRGKAPVRVFYQIWHEPLITLNGHHLVSDVIALCGGRNVFADAVPLVPNVGIEAVLQANPEVIILGGSEDDGTAGVDWWQDWPAIEAVRHRRVYAIPPDLMQRHSERILDGAELLCGILDEARR
jgi:iron complex transport system substrate-binding protein